VRVVHRLYDVRPASAGESSQTRPAQRSRAPQLPSPRSTPAGTLSSDSWPFIDRRAL
jgi:hypothetical protein